MTGDTVQSASKGARNSNLEILRIMAMFMVVFFHIFHWGEMTLPAEPDVNTIVFGIGRFCGQIGVLVFFLITGYFMVAQKFTVRKLVWMVLEIWFYSWALMLIFVSAGLMDISNLVWSLLPLTMGEWWFMDVYLALMILSPFINSVLRTASKREYQIIIGVLFFLTYVLYLTEQYPRYSTAFGTAVTVYCIAGYIRLHQPKIAGRKPAWAILSIGVILEGAILAILCMDHYDSFFEILDIWDNRTSIYELIVALGLFLVFLNMKERHIPWVNWVASSVFAVYLIHQAMPVKHILWTEWLDMAGAFQHAWFPLYAVGCTLLVFVVCVLIDKVRIRLIFDPLKDRIDGLAEKLERKIGVEKE